MVDPDLKEGAQLWVEGANVLSHKRALESLSPQATSRGKVLPPSGRSDVGGAEERGRVRESGMNSNSQPARQSVGDKVSQRVDMGSLWSRDLTRWRKQNFHRAADIGSDKVKETNKDRGVAGKEICPADVGPALVPGRRSKQRVGRSALP